MSRITREEAIDIAKSYVGVRPYIEITDRYDPAWVFYNANSLVDCWYVIFRQSMISFTVGPSYMVAVSKKDGGIRFSGLTGGS